MSGRVDAGGLGAWTGMSQRAPREPQVAGEVANLQGPLRFVSSARPWVAVPRNQGPTWQTPTVCRGPPSCPEHFTGGQTAEPTVPRSQSSEFAAPAGTEKGHRGQWEPLPPGSRGPASPVTGRVGCAWTLTNCPRTCLIRKKLVSCEPRRLMAEATSEGGRSYTGHMENAQEGARGIRLFVLIAENPAGSDGNSEFRARKGSFTPGLDKHSQLPTGELGVCGN